jgi:hypothetical protein
MSDYGNSDNEELSSDEEVEDDISESSESILEEKENIEIEEVEEVKIEYMEIPRLTSFEMVKVLSERANQIDNGSKTTLTEFPEDLPYSKSVKNNLLNKFNSFIDRTLYSSKEIAELEFYLKVIPEFSIVRILSNKKKIEIPSTKIKFFPLF